MCAYSLVSCCSDASGLRYYTDQAYMNIDLLLLNSGCSKTIVSFNATASHDQNTRHTDNHLEHVCLIAIE